MYGCESWTVKKAERPRIDAFELWCWRRLLRFPWTARRSNQSIWRRPALGFLLKEWCWSWNSSPLATSCEELTHWKRLWVNSGSWWWTGRPDVLQFMGSQRVGHDWATELNWGCCYLWGLLKLTSCKSELTRKDLRISLKGNGIMEWNGMIRVVVWHQGLLFKAEHGGLNEVFFLFLKYVCLFVFGCTGLHCCAMAILCYSAQASHSGFSY